MTFSDQPPPSASNAKVTATTPGGGGTAASAGLPFELRQGASKYPVTLYTGENCGPCGSARNLLTNRGIPFSERTVSWMREELSIAFSSDDGRSWAGPTVVARQRGVWLSYPFVLERRPGEIWITTMQGLLQFSLNESDFVD